MKTDRTLQISVRSIPETGKEIRLELGKEWFDLWRREDPALEFSQGSVQAVVRLAKHGRDILVRGRLEGALELVCSRCLEPFSAPQAADFDLLLAPTPLGQAPEEKELSREELDLDFYAGEIVDLEPLIREQIILMVPLKPLCREDCRGLCPSCGANLNRESCSCQAQKGASTSN
jgi:uncharacterized protein